MPFIILQIVLNRGLHLLGRLIAILAAAVAFGRTEVILILLFGKGVGGVEAFPLSHVLRHFSAY
jgi:hypothetical protein